MPLRLFPRPAKVGQPRSWPAPLGVAVAVLLLTATGVADRWELTFRDGLLRAAPRHRPVFTVAVVVDDAALATFGRFPWPRERLAEVVSAVAEAGARGLVVDLLLAEPAPGDQALAAALRRLPSVLAAVPAADGHGWLRPAPRLAAAARLAHAAYDPDHDGVVRRLAATKQAEGEALPALPLAAAGLIYPLPIPVGAVLRPDFLTRARDIPQVSVAEVLSGASGARLKDRVVFLGATAAGLGDRVMTPTSPPGSPEPGVLVQAAIAEGLLRGGVLRRLPPWAAAFLAGLAFVALRGFRRRGWLSLPVTLAMALVLPLVAGAAALFLLRCEAPQLTWALTLAAGTSFSGVRLARRVEAFLADVPAAPAGEAGALRTPEARIARLLELARTAARLQEEQRAQSRLLAHELKTPLAGLAGLGQLLAAYELAPEERQRVAGLLATEATRLAQLVDTLLELESLSLRPFPADAPALDLAALVRQRVELAAAGLARPLELEAPAPVPVRGVASLLAEAVDNLLANAHKFSPPGTPVWVRVLAMGDGKAVVEVEDRGPGVPPEERDVIFRRFARGKTGQGQPGLGLGLSLVREVVTWHGGEVSVEEAQKGGSVFRITLPLVSG